MKKVVLFALLLAAAVSASAEVYPGNNGLLYGGPDRGANHKYRCHYANYSGSAIDGGLSYWDLPIVYQDSLGRPMPRGSERFEALDRFGNTYWESYKATWAKPEKRFDAHGISFTRWEFTFNPYGPQCTKTDVYFNGYRILFNDCSDGHSRTCSLLY